MKPSPIGSIDTVSRRKQFRGVLYSIAVILVATGHSGIGMAAETDRGLEEIVVVANKRVEPIQTVPVSMSAIGGEQLAEMQAADIKDLDKVVPALQMRTEFGVSTPFAYIRGIGNNGFVTTSISPVGFYTDGVYIGQNIAQGLQLFDIERIEVLRGPQGTLFGRNTTGGLINVIVKKPVPGAGTNGELRVAAGDYGTLNLTGAVGGDISSTLAYRIAINRQSDDGMFRNVNPDFVGDRNVGDTDASGARALFLWQPSDSFFMLLNLHWGASDGGMVINKAGWLPDATGSNCPAGAVPGALYNGCSDPSGYGLTETNGWFESNESFAGTEDVETYGLSAELNWTLGEHTVTSLTAWDDADTTRLQDTDGSSLAFMHAAFIPDTSYWSQELRVTSDYVGAWNWIAGVNYYGDRNETFTHYGFGDLGGTGIGQSTNQKTESYGIFGEVNYNFAEGWTAVLGLRETVDRRSANIETWLTNAYGVTSAPAAPATIIPAVPANDVVTESMARAALLAPLIPYQEVRNSWRKWSGRLSLSYAFDDDLMVYASVSHGFKGGEFNGAAIISPTEVTLSNPEYLDNYELGLKSTWFGQRLRANISVFYMPYEDQQVMSYIEPGAVFPALNNLASSEIKGFEFELLGQVGAGWTLGLNGSYLDAHITSFPDPVLGDRSGNRLNDAPEWSLSGLVRYEHNLAQGELTLEAQGYWSSWQYFQIQNQPGLKTGSYGIVDVRAAYTFPSDKIEIGIFAKNLLDKGHVSSGFDLNAFGSNVFQMGHPRIVGANFTYRYY